MGHVINSRKKIIIFSYSKMSLIVLSSKGDDPEDFSNYMTQGVKIPKNAEVCLVSSHINRKLQTPREISIAAGSNTFALSYGSGVDTDRDGINYTPHSPMEISLSQSNNKFPIHIAKYTSIENYFNNFMNESNNIPISTITNGAWINDINQDKFTFRCRQRKPDRAASEGSSIASDFRVRAGINDQMGQVSTGETLENNTGFGEGAKVAQSTDANRTNYVKLSINALGSVSESQGNFIDTQPLWNTDTGAEQGTFEVLGSRHGVVGGAWYWDVSCGAISVDTDTHVLGMRGGIVAGNKFNFEDASNDYNILLDPQTGGTNFDIWWQIDGVGPSTVSVGFYYRRNIGIDKQNSPSDNDVVKFGSVRRAVTLGQDLRLMLRPCRRSRDGNPISATNFVYCIDAGFGIVTHASGDLSNEGSANQGGTLGYADITDKYAVDSSFNLYQYLPLRQGTSFAYQNAANRTVQQSAIHHKLGASKTELMDVSGLPITIGTSTMNQTQINDNNLDSSWSSSVARSTLGTTLGFTEPVKNQTMQLMGTNGIISDVRVESSIQTAHTLVVQLPDLSITGFYGNTQGTADSGTLNINGGGNSAPILATIPFGNPTRITDLSSVNSGYLDLHKGQYFAAPVENWIRVNNPNSLVLSSLRCRLTDELGSKPNMLDPNTTIVIKIRERADVKNVIQGGTVARPDES